MKRKIDVTLLGHRFTVRSEREESHVHALAGYVQAKLEEVRRSARHASPHEQALLVALNLAEELFDEAERAASVRSDVRRRTESLVAKLREALSEGDDAREVHETGDAPAGDVPALAPVQITRRQA